MLIFIVLFVFIVFGWGVVYLFYVIVVQFGQLVVIVVVVLVVVFLVVLIVWWFKCCCDIVLNMKEEGWMYVVYCVWGELCVFVM